MCSASIEDLAAAILAYNQIPSRMESWMKQYPDIAVTDMHTGGEPLRIITSGYPPIDGATILEKRRYVADHLDHLRKFLLFEPRGHKEMYGALLVEPRLPEADLAVLFMHNEGYSTMCGHAVIALGRYAIDAGIVALQQPKTVVNIECPCGLVRVEVDATTREASFLSAPAFVLLHDQPIDLGDGRSVHVDISYGGAFYAVGYAWRGACEGNGKGLLHRACFLLL